MKTTLIRWLKFNAVGAMGMAVQLGALAILHRLLPGHYLWATAAAIELTLLHNFTWHMHYTWRDRADGGVRQRLLRFHLTSGLVSMVGNLTLMRLLVDEARLPVVAANAVAILACSLLNFWLGNRWAFAEAGSPPRGIGSRVPVSATVLLFCMIGGVAFGQSAPAQPGPHDRGLGTDCAYENWFVGPSLGAGRAPTFTGGVTIGQYFARTLGKGLVGSPQFELGLAGPLPKGNKVDGLVSLDYMFANEVPRWNAFPFVTVGYTRLFVTGNALNFGLGMDFGSDERLVRIELRDYYLVTGPAQHVVGLRIGFGKLIAD